MKEHRECTDERYDGGRAYDYGEQHFSILGPRQFS
jgi:hypothetical protein